MKLLLIFLLLIVGIVLSSKAQWNSPQLLGAYVDRPYGENFCKLTRIDPATGQLFPIGIFEKSYDIINQCEAYAIDSKHMRFFCDWAHAYDMPHLYTIDLITGDSIYSRKLVTAQLADPTFTCGEGPLLYNMETDQLLGIFHNFSSYSYIVSIEPSTGIVDTILNLGPEYFYFISQGIDYINHRIFCYQLYADTPSIEVIDYSNWTVIKTLKNSSARVFDCANGMLYGEENQYMYEIDPADGVKQFLSNTGLNSDYSFWGSWAVDPFAEKIFIGALGPEIITYDLSAGEVNTSYVLNPDSVPYTFNQTFILYEPPNVNAFFSSKMCSGNAVHFFGSSDTSYNWNWNFGDPVSGDNNFSNEENPIHFFSDTGLYKVTLASSICYAADTFSEWVHVVTLPQVSLVNDTVICTDYNYGPIILKQPADSSYQITWQNGSHDSTCFVKQPGVYTLNVTDACGVRSDTITVAGMKCGCEVRATSDLIFNSTTIYIECDISNFPGLRAEVFNDIGQIIFSEKIDQPNQEILLNNVASGIYFLRLVDGSDLLRVEKVMVQR